ARKRRIGLRRALQPDRAAAPGGVAEADRTRRVQHGHHAGPDERRRDEQQPGAVERMGPGEAGADPGAAGLERGPRVPALEHAREPALRERARAALDVAFEDVADPRPPGREERFPESLDLIGQAIDDVPGAQLPLDVTLDRIAPTQAALDLEPGARGRRRP